MISTGITAPSRVAALSAVPSCTLAAALACQTSDRVDSAAIAHFVLSQVRVDRIVAGLPTPTFGVEAISIEPFDSLGSLRIYRVTPWILEHWHPYLVGVSSSGLHGLGGFPCPDFARAISASGTGWYTQLDVPSIARRLSRLLDPNGSGDIAFIGDSTKTEELRLAWRRAIREGFPKDSTGTNDSVQRFVRINILSHRTKQYPPAWQRVTFAFEFGPNKELLSWTTVVGPASYAIESN
jgi:hypothetical protein